MSPTVEFIAAALLVFGAVFAWIGSLGLLRMPDFYMRLHGPTKASTLGLGGLLCASALVFSVERGSLTLHEVLITVFLFITAPVSAHILAKTAMHKRVPFTGGQEDPLLHPLNLVPESMGVDHAQGLDLPPPGEALPGEAEPGEAG